MLKSAVFASRCGRDGKKFAQLHRFFMSSNLCCEHSRQLPPEMKGDPVAIQFAGVLQVFCLTTPRRTSGPVDDRVTAGRSAIKLIVSENCGQRSCQMRTSLNMLQHLCWPTRSSAREATHMTISLLKHGIPLLAYACSSCPVVYVCVGEVEYINGCSRNQQHFSVISILLSCLDEQHQNERKAIF
ncbi:unnamed protein product [Protopolystoma xenopodis]|uniref:Uncharacterized protein n=1 Tax=Protopolystoma xenopodis TaxID=117903 RepID=A0A3S5AG70_9PLAT|nr:unnamed protein product [Protopolystoma xenopodis]